ncbi:MAG: lysyl oxidase family protein [Acidimicrobiia bacterium]
MSSCYPEEVAEQGARRCLRFDQVIANVGDGPFELRYRMEGLATDQQLRQRIYASDGTFTDVVVDSYEFHPVHAHFHYKNFGQAFLYRPRPDGTMEKIRESRKNGFCMIDVENTRFGADPNGVPYKGEAPRTYYFPRCNTATERDEHGTYMVNGISVGWADVYNWFLADQYIEISGVPDGVYVLETVANPARTVHETTFDDNTARITIRLRGDSVELVSPASSAR